MNYVSLSFFVCVDVFGHTLPHTEVLVFLPPLPYPTLPYGIPILFLLSSSCLIYSAVEQTNISSFLLLEPILK